MQNHPTSGTCPLWNCIYCQRSIPRGSAIQRAGHSYHVRCLLLALKPLDRAHRRRRLRLGLLPAGKDRNARRPNLYKNHSPSTEVGGHA